jgi:hypothetical protein
VTIFALHSSEAGLVLERAGDALLWRHLGLPVETTGLPPLARTRGAATFSLAGGFDAGFAAADHFVNHGQHQGDQDQQQSQRVDGGRDARADFGKDIDRQRIGPAAREERDVKVLDRLEERYGSARPQGGVKMRQKDAAHHLAVAGTKVKRGLLQPLIEALQPGQHQQHHKRRNVTDLPQHRQMQS